MPTRRKNSNNNNTCTTVETVYSIHCAQHRPSYFYPYLKLNVDEKFPIVPFTGAARL